MKINQVKTAFKIANLALSRNKKLINNFVRAFWPSSDKRPLFETESAKMYRPSLLVCSSCNIVCNKKILISSSET